MSTRKNIGEQIGEAIQEAIADQDFSKLSKTVKSGIDFAARSINASLAQAAQASRDARTQAQSRAGQPAPPRYPGDLDDTQGRPVPPTSAGPATTSRPAQIARFGSLAGFRASGYLIAIGGGLFAFLLAVLGLVSLAGASMGLAGADPAFMADLAGTFGLFAAAFAGITAFGVRRIGLSSRFATYQRIIGNADSITIAELASRSGKSQKRVLKDLGKLIARGTLAQGRLSEDGSTLFVTDEAFARFEESRRAALRQREQEALEREAAGKDAAGQPISPQAQAILDKGSAYIEQIRRQNDDIPGEEVSAKISQIEAIVASIFKRAKEHPEVIDDLDQLLDYYLPVTVKLLDAYEELDSQPIQSEQILRSKREIEDTLDTLNTAFSKLLDSIFKDMTWDVSTDISVLHTVLAQEGLVDNPFENKSGETR